MKKILTVLILFLITLNTFCQTRDSNFFSHFQLRQTFQTADGNSSPAQLQFTLPGGGKNSWLVDAAAALTLDQLSGTYGNSRMTGEYHRNTALYAQQNNYQFGYNYQYLKPTGQLNIGINSSLKYIRDVQDTSNSLALTVNFSPYLPGINKVNLGRNAYFDNRHYTYSLTPYVELQYQRLFATTNGIKNGAIFRPLANLSGSIAINRRSVPDTITKIDTVNHRPVIRKIPKVAKPSKLIEFCSDLSVRYALLNTSTNEGFSKLFKAGVNYYLLDAVTTSVSIGINYNIGSDPLNGLKDQRYWQLALQVQF